MKPLAILVAACVVSVCFSDSLHAQRRRPYSSRRPPISPWVTVSRSTNGGINSYFGFVRPRQEFMAFADQTMQFAASQRALDRQASYELFQLERSIEEGIQRQSLLQQRPTSTVGRAPARAASFLDYSRFYPQSAPVGGSPGGRYLNR